MGQESAAYHDQKYLQRHHQPDLYQVLSVHMPGKVGDYDGSTPLLGHGIGEPTIIRLSTPLLTLVAVDEDFSEALLTGFPWALDKPVNSVFPLRADTGRNPMYPDSLPLITRPVPPGKNDEIRLSLRFGAGNIHREQLAHDVLTRYAQAHPAQLQWNDRRPIGMIMLSTSATGWPTNPRGWFYDRNVNVTTPEGLQDFRQRLHVFARNSISIMRDMNAQGMITWDIEGQEFQHPVSYVGDPRLAAQLAPEMADVADQYFAEFRQAGFRVGICIRPDRAVLKSSGNLTHETATEPEEELAQKITFARDRWGATLFYVDSNGGPAWPMDAGVFERLARRFPDVLLIPEHKTLQYYAYTAPYQELRGGHTSTPSLASTVFPRAFSCINTADGQPAKHVQELAQARRKGDMFLYRTWFQDPENKVLRDLNRSLRADNRVVGHRLEYYADSPVRYVYGKYLFHGVVKTSRLIQIQICQYFNAVDKHVEGAFARLIPVRLRKLQVYEMHTIPNRKAIGKIAVSRVLVERGTCGPDRSSVASPRGATAESCVPALHTLPAASVIAAPPLRTRIVGLGVRRTVPKLAVVGSAEPAALILISCACPMVDGAVNNPLPVTVPCPSTLQLTPFAPAPVTLEVN